MGDPTQDEEQRCGCVIGARLVCVKHCGGHAIPKPSALANPVTYEEIVRLRSRVSELEADRDEARRAGDAAVDIVLERHEDLYDGLLAKAATAEAEQVEGQRQLVRVVVERDRLAAESDELRGYVDRLNGENSKAWAAMHTAEAERNRIDAALSARVDAAEAERDDERRERAVLGAYAMGVLDSDHERWAEPWGPPLWAYMQWGRAEADRLFPDGWPVDAAAKLIDPTPDRLVAAEARAERAEQITQGVEGRRAQLEERLACMTIERDGAVTRGLMVLKHGRIMAVKAYDRAAEDAARLVKDYVARAEASRDAAPTPLLRDNDQALVYALTLLLGELNRGAHRPKDGNAVDLDDGRQWDGYQWAKALPAPEGPAATAQCAYCQERVPIEGTIAWGNGRRCKEPDACPTLREQRQRVSPGSTEPQ